VIFLTFSFVSYRIKIVHIVCIMLKFVLLVDIFQCLKVFISWPSGMTKCFH